MKEKSKKTRLLVLSFSSLMAAFRDDKVAVDDLTDSIYYFDTDQTSVLRGPGDDADYRSDVDRIFQHSSKNGFVLSQLVCVELLMAQHEHRVIWPRTPEERNYQELNLLLSINGFKKLTVGGRRLTNRGVACRARNTRLPLRVIG